MSLVRNFTRRARAHTRGDDSSSTTTLPRSCTVRYAPGTINRAKISLPTELISTTNVQALNAPDIRKASGESTSPSSSSSSVHSSSNDYFSGLDKGFLTADNSSSSDFSPVTPITPFSDIESKDFFSAKPAVTPSLALHGPLPVPAIPQRAPSHSKKAHVALSRERSIKRSMSPPPSDIANSITNMSSHEQHTPRDTVAMFASPKASDVHPFTKELAKVNEVAEEFGGMGMVLDEEEQEMLSKGLQKFSVRDYIQEISGGVFEDQLGLNPWI